MIKPRIEERGMVFAICLVSSLLILIDPKSVNEICFAALVGSLPLIIIVKASLIANVAITTKTKLIPSDKNEPYDMKELILKVADEEDFLEVQKEYANNIIIGFATSAEDIVGYITEENTHVVFKDNIESRKNTNSKNYILAFDPLDGSKNVGSNITNFFKEFKGI